MKAFFLSFIKNGFLDEVQPSSTHEAKNGDSESLLQSNPQLQLPPLLHRFACCVQSSIHRLGNRGIVFKESDVLNQQQKPVDMARMSDFNYNKVAEHLSKNIFLLLLIAYGKQALNQGGLGQQNNPSNFVLSSSRELYSQQQKQFQTKTHDCLNDQTKPPNSSSEFFTPLNELYQLQYV